MQSGLMAWLVSMGAVILFYAYGAESVMLFTIQGAVMNFNAEYMLAPWMMLFGTLASVGGILAAPYLPIACSTNAWNGDISFVDVTSIDQMDARQKMRGVYSIGGVF
mmetsp:Transcript_2700/g.6489  ORF Transcript_2700/g.6489 Transcript_2700/m.6489 type:complete len:107 (+) Transcript_2700:11-331(+)